MNQGKGKNMTNRTMMKLTALAGFSFAMAICGACSGGGGGSADQNGIQGGGTVSVGTHTISGTVTAVKTSTNTNSITYTSVRTEVGTHLNEATKD